MEGRDSRTMAVVDLILSVLCPSTAPEEVPVALSDYPPGTSYLSVGLCLPGSIWAEMSNLKGELSRARVTIRHKEQCAAGVAAEKAAGSFEYPDRDWEVQWSQNDGGGYPTPWEDYACAMQQSAAHDFISMAFIIYDAPGASSSCLASVGAYRRIFTLTLGARSLSLEMKESLQRLGHALAPALAPHLPQLLASLDHFLLPGVFGAPVDRGDVHRALPAGPPSDPDTDPSEALSEATPDPLQAKPASPPSHHADPRRQTPPVQIGPCDSRGSAYGSSAETVIDAACPCPCPRGSRGTHADVGGDEVSTSLRGAAQLGGKYRRQESLAEAALPQKVSGVSAAAAETGPGSDPKGSGSYLPGKAASSCSTEADVGMKKGLDKPLGKRLQSKGLSVGGVSSEGQTRPGAGLTLDLMRDPLWLTFRAPQIEGAFQGAARAKRMKMDLWMLLFLGGLWLVGSFTRPVADGPALSQQFTHYVMGLLYLSLLAIRLFQPSRFSRHRQWGPVLIKLGLGVSYSLFMRQVKAKQLPGDLFGAAFIITCIYIMEAMAMQVNFRWALPWEILSMALWVLTFYYGCSSGCVLRKHRLSAMACQASFGAFSIVFGHLLPIGITWYFENRDRAAFARTLGVA